MLSTVLILMKKKTKFKVGDPVRTSKYKNIFTKGYTANWSEEVYVIIKIKIQFDRLMLMI